MEMPLHSVPAEPATLDAVPIAFEDLVEAESARLFRALFLITGNRAEAEEVMQDALLAVWERWDRVGAMDDPTGYLFRTALNLFRKRLRRAAVAARKVVRPSLGTDDFAAIEDREVVFAALRELKPNERAAIVVTALLGYSSEEAARLLGTTPGTVRALASRARAAMKRAVGELT